MSVIKRSVNIAGHASSVSLEAEFWEELKAIAQKRGISMNALIGEIDEDREGNLSSALRIYVLKTLQGKL